MKEIERSLPTYRGPVMGWGIYYPYFKNEETEAQKYPPKSTHIASMWGTLDLNPICLAVKSVCMHPLC